MKAKYNGLYNLMVEHEGERFDSMTLQQMGQYSGLDHPEKVKQGIAYLVKNKYLSFLPGMVIATHDGVETDEFIGNVNSFLTDYRRMQTLIKNIITLLN